jgi:hypothetical protein
MRSHAGLELWSKRLQILREVIPAASRVAFLTLSPWQSADVLAMRKPARQAGISLVGPALESPVQDTEYRRVLGAMVQQRADGLIVGLDSEPAQLLEEYAISKNVPGFTHITDQRRGMNDCNALHLRGPLGARRERPRSNSTNHSDEVPPPHSITS